jgi:ubiquitin carboxyl-terminal hydrolase 9/13
MNYENSTSYGMSESLFTALKDIFEAIIAHTSRMGVVSPVKFLEILRKENEMFRTAMHQDAHEFLNLLLNEVVDNVEKYDTLTRKTLNGSLDTTVATPSLQSTSWIHSLFEGTLTSETRCLTCETTSHRAEAFLDLSVDLEQNSSVTACLRKFSEEEMLCERNKFHCDTCGGLQEAEKRMKIHRLPKILALHLKRFKYTEDLQRLQKLFHRVVYPYHLRLFNTTDDAEDPDRLYELYAVVVHIGGGPYHGHYVSIIKTPDRGWLLFDDEMVEPVDRSYVRNFFGGDNALACAYVLFYQETTLEAVQREEAEAAAAEMGTKTEANGHATAPNTPLVPELVNGFNPQTKVSPFDSTEATDVSTISDPARSDPVSGSETNGIPHIPPIPPTPEIPSSPLRRVKSDLPNNRKEKARAEKERKEKEKERKAADKAAEKLRLKEEKEREKAEAIKRRDRDAKRRELQRANTEDYLKAIKASKESKAEEDKRQKAQEKSQKKDGRPVTGYADRKSGEVEKPISAIDSASSPLLGNSDNPANPTNSTSSTGDSQLQRTKTGPTVHSRSSHTYNLSNFGLSRNKERQNSSSVGEDSDTPNGTEKNGKPINGNVVSAGLSRFRHSSMSLRSKPKFWSIGSPKDLASRATDEASKSGNEGHDTDESTNNNNNSNMTALPTTPTAKEEGRSRFGLGKKKSTNLF